jgi:hypothetical protein
MSWKGRHSRNWIWADIDYNRSEYELEYEKDASDYGVFGVIGNGYDDEDGEWYVIWRPNRNHTTEYYVKVMSKIVQQYSWGGTRDEPIKYDTLDDAISSITTRWQNEFERPEKPKRYRPRDSQKSKLYRWEHIMAREIGPTEPNVEGKDIDMLHRKRDHIYLRMFLNAVCNELGEDKVDLKFRSGGRSSFGGLCGIQLLPCHCHHLVLLHELAHVLHVRWGKKTNGKKHQSHGKEFTGVFAYLLIRFGGIDKTGIIRHAREFKVNLLLPEQYWDWKEQESKAA